MFGRLAQPSPVAEHSFQVAERSVGVLLALVVESAARSDGLGVDAAALARAVQRRVEDLTIYRSSIEAS